MFPRENRSTSSGRVSSFQRSQLNKSGNARRALAGGRGLAFNQTVIAKLKLGEFGVEGIYLKPTEFSGWKTNTRLAGGTLEL